MCPGAAFCAHLPVSYPYTVLYYTKISMVTTHRGRVVVTRVSGNRLVTFRHLEIEQVRPFASNSGWVGLSRGGYAEARDVENLTTMKFTAFHMVGCSS